MNDMHDTNETYDTYDTEQQLSQAIAAFADNIHPAADAYCNAQREWHRRERRRRMILATLIMVVFASATLLGLWVLNQTSAAPHSIFGGGVSVPAAMSPFDMGTAR
jgi:hypothetical protein